MADHSICLSPTCKAWADGDVDVCPKCGGPMKGGKKMTGRGWLLLLLGLALAGFMAWLTLAMLPTLARPGETVEGSTFTGSADDARMILWLFGLVIMVGTTFAINGAIIIATGRQSRVFTIVSLGLAALLVVVAVVTTRTLGGSG